MKYISILFMVCICLQVNAWDGVVKGEINVLEITHEENYGFRVHLKGAPKLCENVHSWAYLNGSHSNYEVFVSALLAAKAAGQTITLYTRRKDGQDTGFCVLHHLAIH